MVRGPRTAMKSGPHLPQLQKALAQKRKPNTAINLKKKKKKKKPLKCEHVIQENEGLNCMFYKSGFTMSSVLKNRGALVSVPFKHTYLETL